MKKLLIISAMLGFAIMAMGQKQQTDAKTFEVNFTPLGGSPISINGIKFRKFSDDYTALRMEVFLGLNNSKDVSLQEGEASQGFGDDEVANPLTYSKTSGFDLSIRPGIEKHFDGTARLSPYIGGVANIGFSTMSATEEYWTLGDNTPDGDPGDGFVEWEQKTKDGSLSLGLTGVAGFDFYFADNIYLGAEFGFGLNFTSNSLTKYSSTDDTAWAIADRNGMDVNFGNGEIEYDNDDPTDDIESVTTRDDEKNGSDFNLGPNVNGALRLGFIF